MLYIIREEAGFQFEWNEAHTVNVQVLDQPERDIDCYSIGDYAKNAATLEEFKASVDEWLEDAENES